MHEVTPAQLWIGEHAHTVQQIEKYLQQKLCAHHGCAVCTACKAIRNRQHHHIMWLAPENNYSLEDIRPLQATLSLALEKNEHYFFVIQKADRLTAACANSLLKSVEEPPAGYHFLFLTERAEHVLPTIRSRCTIHTLHTTQKSAEHTHTFYHIFTTAITHSPATFLKELDAHPPSEQESIEIVDAILAYWVAERTRALHKDPHTRAQGTKNIIKQLLYALSKPPMPGSSKIFWKNLYLNLKNTDF